jgi:hypothetical protein
VTADEYGEAVAAGYDDAADPMVDEQLAGQDDVLRTDLAGCHVHHQQPKLLSRTGG